MIANWCFLHHLKLYANVRVCLFITLLNYVNFAFYISGLGQLELYLFGVLQNFTNVTELITVLPFYQSVIQLLIFYDLLQETGNTTFSKKKKNTYLNKFNVL
jgi:hypothetical protein